MVALTCARTAHAVSWPYLKWHTIETAHFRINYYSGEEEIAQTVGRLAEDIHGRLAPAVGWAPKSRTEILLTDDSDTANGSATALPYNAIRLYVTAPDDLSPLGDVDEWYQELVTHEYTHILHTDHIHGIPAWVNAVLGKTLAPNQTEPHWMLEGLAVFEESDLTSGGRLRSSEWNMFMRADVLEDNVATLDQFSNDVRRWPQGNIWYLYGSFFMRWIADTYGSEAIRKMIDDYGGQIVPYGINRSTRRATGKTFEELYDLWIADLKKEVKSEVEGIRSRGLREGKRITFGGQTVQHPRFIPEGTWPGRAGDVLFYEDDAHTTAGLYALDMSGKRTRPGAAPEKQLMARTATVSAPTWDPDGRLYFDSADIVHNIFAYNDLATMAAGEIGVRGLEGNRQRLTEGARASDPDVSPDGRQIVFCTNHRGTRYLQIADVDHSAGDGTAPKLTNVHALVKSYRFEQAYAPRWSPDGKTIAYSVWVKGGYRDIRLVDVATGTVRNVTSDRAIESGPSFSKDGRWLFFHSDRTSVTNVYAFELASGRLMQVTNVLGGAYQPETSPDGKTLVYVGYTHEGFDLFSMPLDESKWTVAEPYSDVRPAPPPEPHARTFPVQDYSPFETLRPRKYSVMINQGDFGYQTTLTVSGTDLASWHSLTGNITSAFDKPGFQGALSYTYSRLPFDVGLGVYRSLSARGGFGAGSFQPTVTQESVGGSASITVPINHPFDSQSVNLTYSFQRVGFDFQLPKSAFDPYNIPTIPTAGFVGALHLGWSYSSVEQYVWSVSPERGLGLSANFDLTDPALASDYHGYDASVNAQFYQPMPWLRNHVLALHAGGGVSGGDFPGRGAFYVGGFVDEPVITSVQNTIVQGGILLRGYPVVAESGAYYALFNAEYRFPILNFEHGPSTLPIFLQRVNGNLFVDYGSAFNTPETAEFKTGSGAELWFDFTFGYVIDMTFRLGYAHGWASEGLDKVYFVAAVPF